MDIDTDLHVRFKSEAPTAYEVIKQYVRNMGLLKNIKNTRTCCDVFLTGPTTYFIM